MPTQLERIIAAIEELADKEWKWSVGAKGVGGEARARYDALMEAADIVRAFKEPNDDNDTRANR